MKFFYGGRLRCGENGSCKNVQLKIGLESSESHFLENETSDEQSLFRFLDFIRTTWISAHF